MSMESTPAQPPDDDELLARLRRIAAEVDPVPEHVGAAARLAIEWRTLDAELAALIEDSRVDEPALAVRAAGAPRALAFEAGELVIEVEAEATGEGELRIVGQLVPAQPAEVVVRHGGALVATRADERGRFAAAGIEAGAISLRVRLAGAGGAARLVETAWLSI